MSAAISEPRVRTGAQTGAEVRADAKSGAGSDLAALAAQPFELMLAIENRLRAARLDIAAGQMQSWTGLGFRLREYWLLVPRDEVREVITLPKMSRIPGARPWLLGVANVRGNLLPVTDLGHWLGYPRLPENRDQRVLVFNSDRIPAGLLVDEVAGYRQFAPADQRHELVRQTPLLEPYLLGGFSREGRNWPALSLRKLTRSAAFAVAAA